MDKTKAIYIGIGILVIGVGGFLLIKKLKRKKNMGIPPEVSGGGKSSGGGGGSSSGGGGGSSSGGGSSWNSSGARAFLYKSFTSGLFGLGTDEALFFDTSNNLTSSQRSQLVSDWNANKEQYGDWDFAQWIDGEFSGDDLRKAKELYNL